MTDIAKIATDDGFTQDETIPGLWHHPNYPELTTGQLQQVLANHLQEQDSE